MQDRAITAIGQLELATKKDLAPWQLYVENMQPGKEYPMLLVCFEQGSPEGPLQYAGVDIERVDDSIAQRYAYRKGSASGGDVTPSTKAGDMAKKMAKVTESRLPALVAAAKTHAQAEVALFTAMLALMVQHQSNITHALTGLYQGLDKKEQNMAGISIRVTEGGTHHYLAHYKAAQHLLQAHGIEGKWKKYGAVSKAANKRCSVCLQLKPEVMGFASPFKYATIDKPGFVSGYFKQARNWANYPICHSCALQMEMGKRYMYRRLKRLFYGRWFFMLPKTVMPSDDASLKKALKHIELMEQQVQKNKLLGRREDHMMRLLGGADNYFSMNLMFYEEHATTKAITIKLMLEEVLPSRFRLLFETLPAQMAGHPLYRNALYNNKTKTHSHLAWSFGHLVHFWDVAQDPKRTDFYAITQKVFMGRPLAMTEVYSRFMERLRKNYTDGLSSNKYAEPNYIAVRKAHMVLRYLRALGIVPQPHTRNTQQNHHTPMEDTHNGPGQAQSQQKAKPKAKGFDMALFTSFVANNADFLDTNAKAGTFAFGVLVRLLLNIQQRELGSTPFSKKFKGYRLGYKDLERLYLEALDKLNQYMGFYAYNDLREYVGAHFTANSHLLASADPNEVSFYFVAGIELGRQFRTEAEATNGNGTTQA